MNGSAPPATRTCARAPGPCSATTWPTAARPVWGLDHEGELRTIWRRSGHPGLWFMGGNLQQARTYSKFLALQIKAIEEGLIPQA